jgi:hypothetical protein
MGGSSLVKQKQWAPYMKGRAACKGRCVGDNFKINKHSLALADLCVVWNRARKGSPCCRAAARR